MCYCEKDHSPRKGCTIVLPNLYGGVLCVIGEAAMDCFDDKRRANQVVAAAKAIKRLLHRPMGVAEAWRVGAACRAGAWLGASSGDMGRGLAEAWLVQKGVGADLGSYAGQKEKPAGRRSMWACRRKGKEASRQQA